MFTFEILSPRIDIVNYLVPRWHVSSTSCNLLFGVKMMSDILVIYHRELFPNTPCLLTIGSHLCVVEFIDHLYIGFCYLFAFFSCQGLYELPLSSIPLVDLVYFLILSKCFLDIVKVVIPPCAFCIQMQILYNALVLGELSYFL